MSKRADFPFSNVIPIRKTDHFGVYTGDVLPSGEVIEGESVGIAFLKQGSKKFRLKLFVYPNNSYFVVPDDKDDAKYIVLSLEEYQLSGGETRSHWNRIGEGKLTGSFIALRLQLIPEPLFLCLFPEKNIAEEDAIAS
tara:strand:- start:38584 stop:38997 length:414 start_codon:yes stop_codon:yes gene_type:complete